MGFAKLDSGITKSSIWSEPYHVRIVWISLLSLKDDSGFVKGARSGLCRACNVTLAEYDSAIEALRSPDEESQNQDNDGRRIDVVPGGIIILNHEQYRQPEEQRKAATRERVRRFRAKNGSGNVTVTPCNAMKRTPPLPSVSVSASASSSVSEEGGGVGEGDWTPESLWLGFKAAFPSNGSALALPIRDALWRKVQAGHKPEAIIAGTAAYKTYTVARTGDDKDSMQADNFIHGEKWLTNWASKTEAERKRNHGTKREQRESLQYEEHIEL